ncbi:alpha-galactosidase [Kitasatospora sp. GAS204A]|uniref:glycoside hydrolase family 36 protein n=1 Tax=unclassified Kitasatospora TaxID=2633591 RepID=UPI00247684F5|nr:alpha-galactosidase [Kitasatospora sp. GAS204B]MDH6117565.1 alpha-galactosidase [Kitasatospora sp. GAS204B]
MSPLNWDGSAPSSGLTESVRELDTGVPGLRLRVTAIGAAGVEARVRGGDQRLLLVEAEPLGERPARVRVEWRLPCAGATGLWRPHTDSRWLPPSWSKPRVADLAAGVPIGSLLGAGDTALCTFAVGELLRPVTIGEGAVEETGEFVWWVEHQVDREPLSLRLDLTGRHFAETIAEMVAWWGTGAQPAAPDGAFEPVFCTWYVRHLEITAAEVERLAALAVPLGFGALIVDDGWQTEETTRSYATTGDWQPAQGPFPDLADHVARVRALGLAYLLWVALPFAGDRSAAGMRFADRRLAHLEELETSVLDPADPEVREHLIERLAALVEEYGADGLKIDFIDTFARHATDRQAVAEGLRALLTGLDERLRPQRPELLIEHRQPYVGPGLWPYATMVRATDCPHNAVENRARTADLRLTAGPLAVHADPLTWHPGERPVEIAVLLQSVLFATAQVSVDLGTQDAGQLAVLRFWLAVMREHVGLLQRGAFRPHRPESGYPLLESRQGAGLAFGRYAPVPITVTGAFELLLVANADPDPLVRLAFDRSPGPLRLLVRDCAGATVADTTVTVAGQELAVTVPRGGLLTLAPADRLGQG